MIKVSRTSKMKSICGFSPFATALVLCLSTIHAIADSEKPFDCALAISVPPAVVEVCPDLDKAERIPGTGMTTKLWVHEHIARALQDIYKRVDKNCTIGVARICEHLPKIVLTSVPGGRQQCERDLQKFVCNGAVDYVKDESVIQCPYYESLQIIIGNPDRWKANEKNYICPLFKENGILCFMVVRKLCERITNVLVKHYCQDGLEKTICAIFTI